MTKQELKWQIDDQQDQINELQKRIEALEARLTWMPYMVTNSMGAPLPFPGSTTMSQHDQNT
jgi:hypothetical protein